MPPASYVVFLTTLVLIFRYGCFQDLLDGIENTEGFDKFTQGYNTFGIHRTKDNGILMREWAPGAEAVYLRGDFSMYCRIDNFNLSVH